MTPELSSTIGAIIGVLAVVNILCAGSMYILIRYLMTQHDVIRQIQYRVDLQARVLSDQHDTLEHQLASIQGLTNVHSQLSDRVDTLCHDFTLMPPVDLSSEVEDDSEPDGYSFFERN